MKLEDQLGSLEAQQEFDRRRNYILGNYMPTEMETVQQRETKAILAMGEAIKALSQQLDDALAKLRLANERVAQLESQVYGGPTK